MTPALWLLVLLGMLGASGVIWRLRRRRAEALMGDLGRALALAAEAEQVHWRLERRYTRELSELARLRRELSPFVDGSRHGRDARWELGASEDGSRFELAILALRVSAPRRLIGHGRRGFRRLLTAHGERGTVAYDSFADERRLRAGAPVRRHGRFPSQSAANR